MAITEDEAVQAAVSFLEELPRLKARFPPERLEQAIRRTWPKMPPPLVLWLITAGLPGLLGREAARRQLYGLEAVMLQNEKRVLTGDVASRVRKILPPKAVKGGDFGHYSTFASSLFELVLGLRLAVSPGIHAEYLPDGPTFDCDLNLVGPGGGIVSVEGYAPQKGLELDYRTNFVAAWNMLVGAGSNEVEPIGTRDLSMDPEAMVKAISRVLTDGNFAKQKRRQLESAGGSAFLAIRAWGLTTRIEDILFMPEASELARRMDPDAWAVLPPNCPGLIISLAGDSPLDVYTNAALMMFVPRPGAVVSPDLWAYLESTVLLSNALLAKGRPDSAAGGPPPADEASPSSR